MTIQGKWYSDDVLVLRTEDMDKLKSFFERLGLNFVEERHGGGQTHFAVQRGETVLEIYPPRGLMA